MRGCAGSACRLSHAVAWHDADDTHTTLAIRVPAMGASIKRSLRPEEVADLQEITPWSSQDIKSLWRRFVKLDRGRIGVIGSQDIMMVPEVAMNPLAQRITAVLEKSRRARDMEDDSGYMINFRSFVCTLAVFSEKAPVEDKVQCEWCPARATHTVLRANCSDY